MPRKTFLGLLRARSGLTCSVAVLLAFLYTSNLSGQITPPPASPASPAQARPVEETNIFLVTFRQGTSASERAAVLQGSGVVLRQNFNVVNAVSVQVTNAASLARLRNNPRVVAVFANRSISLHQVAVQAKGGNPGGGGQGGGGGNDGGGGSGGRLKAPSNLTASEMSSSEISLAWTDNSKKSEDGFQVERCTGAGCTSFAQIFQVGADVVSYNDSGLAAGTTYSYRMRAYDSAGSYSAYSNIAEATTASAPATVPPTAPSSLNATASSYRQIDLAWSDNSDNEDGFQVERCTGTGCTSFAPIFQLGANVTSYSDPGLDAEPAYTYRVRAVNAAGSSAYSTPAEATTPVAPASSQVVPAGVERIGAAPGVLSVTGAGVGVAIVDTGIDFSHPDLGMAPEVEGVNAFNAFGGSCQDFFGHGTHVAGIVAARDNAVDVVGVAPDTTLYCVNVFTFDPNFGASATEESLIAGLDWVATNANLVEPAIRVVNMSLGGDRTPDHDDPNHPMRLAVKALTDINISVVVSAGNDPEREVLQELPASFPEVMAIAATTAVDGLNGYPGLEDLFGPCQGEQRILADTASYFTTDGAFIGGTGVTVSAPGERSEDIYDYLSSGGCFLESNGILSTAMDGGTIRFAGTSMSAPHVAGVVALMWEKELGMGLNLDPEVARTRIRNSVDRPGTAPLDSPIIEYSFDGEREGVIWAPAAVGEASPPEPDQPPTVTITSPADGSTFDPGSSINFQGTVTDPEDGNIANSLVWTSSRDGQIGTGGNFSKTLSGGIHTITVSVTDAGGNVVQKSINITVGSSTSTTAVQVSSITYAMQGLNLLINVELDDEFGGPVAGAAVSIQLYEWLWGTGPWTADGTTNTQGVVQFQLSNAPWGCYVTTVTDIVADGLTWDGITPDNSFCN